MNSDSLRVIFATPECAPLVKTGGLGDVSASLPAALARLGVDVKILLPGYAAVLKAVPHAREIALVSAYGAFPKARILEVAGPGGTPLLILDCPPLYQRGGGPYEDERGEDWPDNALRFGLLSRVAAVLGSDHCPLPWRAQIVHCNDWQTGLAPAYLAFAKYPRAASLFTIHNVSYQGIFAPEFASELGLPLSSFSPEGVEYYGKLCFLKAGLYYAEAITTVSPTHAREIQTEALGFGMHGLLAKRRANLSGILNGIDTELWDPSADPLITYRYDMRTLSAKVENKRSLQTAVGLARDDEVPLLGMVSRLAPQKGVDLLVEIASTLIGLPAQIAIQGVGDALLQRELLALAQAHPKKIAVKIGFNEPLAHSIEAGADIFLMPSRFEPCGMNQMYSQRYGTPPVVRATGGLIDSVVDFSPATLADGTATGFMFGGSGTSDLQAAIERAVKAYYDKATWRSLQRNGMSRDFSWNTSAKRYLELYRRIAGR